MAGSRNTIGPRKRATKARRLAPSRAAGFPRPWNRPLPPPQDSGGPPHPMEASVGSRETNQKGP
eukprot:9324658-Alexandrium_andersonii.AAC.1